MPRTSDLAEAIACKIYSLRLDGKVARETFHVYFTRGYQAHRKAHQEAWIRECAAVIREALGEMCGWRPCGCTEAERPDCERCGGEGVLVVWGTTAEEVSP